MAEFIERVATEWYEIRAGRVRVLKGHPPHARLAALRRALEGSHLPVTTGFWVTRDRRIHFKLNFPQDLRAAVREIVIP